MDEAPSPDHVFEALWTVAVRQAAQRATASTELVDNTMHSLGSIHRHEHELRAGEYVLNDDRDLLPPIARATGLGLCVYLGNRRIAVTTVVDAGPAPEIGGYADAVLVDAVLRNKQVFSGTLEQQGRRTIVACRPLLARERPDEYGAIGMIEAFQDEQTLREVMDAGLREGGGRPTVPETAAQADRMEGVMHFIDDVARRLQLLALNGNIIAAQAGEHGRAFRVVCRELSNLADQSKEAVAEVRKLTHAMGFGADDAYTAEAAQAEFNDEGPIGEAS